MTNKQMAQMADKVRQNMVSIEMERAKAKIEAKADLYVHDFMAGYTDRMNHFYDKYYRYSREDNGAAYDAGCVQCGNERHSAKWYEEDEKTFRIIEVNECNK